MPQVRTPEEFAAKGLKEIHSAERELVGALPKLARTVQHDALKQMLERRHEMGEQLIEELDSIFDELEVHPGRQKNHAAEGLLADVNEHLEDIDDPAMRDAAMIAGVQKVLHYCVAAWGTSRSLGELLGQQQVVEVMRRVLDEGRQMDEQLTQLAESEVNPEMLAGEEGEDEEMEADAKPARKKSGGKSKRK
jgi:ferritin-like metal-binding protein YciE